MEGPSFKEANIYSNGAQSHSMSSFNHSSAPPPYQAASSYPHPHPDPGTESERKFPEAMNQQQYPGAIRTQPGVTITQQPGVSVVQPGASVTSTTAVVGNTVVQAVYVQPMLGSQPTSTRCPSCNVQVTTRVEYRPETKTHLFALLLCVCLLWPCACIPYCRNDCQAAQHYCSNCGAYIGTRSS